MRRRRGLTTSIRRSAEVAEGSHAAACFQPLDKEKSLAWDSQRTVVLQYLRLPAFIQRQLRLDRALQADIEVTAIPEFEVDLGSIITILEDRHLTNHFADKFCTFNQGLSPNILSKT